MPLYNKSACEVCSKCARTFHSRGTNENVIIRKNLLLVKLHMKKCKGKMNLSPSIRNMIAQRQMDNHLNVIPQKTLRRAKMLGSDDNKTIYGFTV